MTARKPIDFPDVLRRLDAGFQEIVAPVCARVLDKHLPPMDVQKEIYEKAQAKRARKGQRK